MPLLDVVYNSHLFYDQSPLRAASSYSTIWASLTLLKEQNHGPHHTNLLLLRVAFSSLFWSSPQLASNSGHRYTAAVYCGDIFYICMDIWLKALVRSLFAIAISAGIYRYVLTSRYWIKYCARWYRDWFSADAKQVEFRDGDKANSILITSPSAHKLPADAIGVFYHTGSSSAVWSISQIQRTVLTLEVICQVQMHERHKLEFG